MAKPCFLILAVGLALHHHSHDASYMQSLVYEPQVFAMLIVRLLGVAAVATVLGGIRIGAFASIRANAVVLKKVPDYAVAVGVPTKVVRINRPEDNSDYRSFQVNQ